MTQLRIAFAACSAVMGISLQADALVLTFSDRASWEGAVSTFQEETFGAGADQLIARDVTFDLGAFDLRYTTDGANESDNDLLTGPDSGDINGTRLLRLAVDNGGNDRTQSLAFEFDSPITAFGALWNGVRSTGPVQLTFDGVTFNLGQELSAAPGSFVDGSEQGGFLGFTFDTPTSTVAFSGVPTSTPTDVFYLDDVVFGTASASAGAIPEPTSFLVHGGLMAFLISAATARRRAC